MKKLASLLFAVLFAASAHAQQLTGGNPPGDSVPFTATVDSLTNPGQITLTSQTSRYWQYGKMVIASYNFTINAIGTAGGAITLTLPVPSTQLHNVSGYKGDGSALNGQLQATGKIVVFTYGGTFPGTAATAYQLTAVYRAD